MIKTIKPVSKDKIIFNTQSYYTCTYSCAVKVRILKLVGKDKVLVQSKTGVFIRPINYVFHHLRDAQRSVKNWERDERRKKKREKEHRKKRMEKERKKLKNSKPRDKSV